ncbi:MAG: hypothetical protein LBD09_02495, partial [Treponema sp.]|nr:hypothetical protein [Treponema sp.]
MEQSGPRRAAETETPSPVSRTPKTERSAPEGFTFWDGLTTVICLAGAVLCLWFFWYEMNRTLTRQNETSVGTISWKYKAAQRRFADRVLWDRIRQGSPVYSGDFIRTEDLSEATITLTEGGARISLEENSLVEIVLKNNVLRINGASGSFGVISGDTGLVLQTGNTTMRVASGSALILNAGEDGMNFRVSEGSVTMDGPEGPVHAGAGSAFFLSASGDP